MKPEVIYKELVAANDLLQDMKAELVEKCKVMNEYRNSEGTSAHSVCLAAELEMLSRYILRLGFALGKDLNDFVREQATIAYGKEVID